MKYAYICLLNIDLALEGKYRRIEGIKPPAM